MQIDEVLLIHDGIHIQERSQIVTKESHNRSSQDNLLHQDFDQSIHLGWCLEMSQKSAAHQKHTNRLGSVFGS